MQQIGRYSINYDPFEIRDNGNRVPWSEVILLLNASHEPADQSVLQATIRKLEARDIAAREEWWRIARERDAAVSERDALKAENKRLCEINTKLDDELARVRDIADARSEILNQQAAKEDTRPTEDELASIWRCAPGTFEAVLVMIKRCGLVREERKS